MTNKITLTLYLTAVCFANQAFASDFNLPFVSSSGLGVSYANWATATDDASTAFTNPAGLVDLPGQQVMWNALGIVGTAQYKGTSTTPGPAVPFPFPINQSGTAHSNIEAFMPSFYYSGSLLDQLSWGFHFTAPFGLGTDYGMGSIVRYASTKSKVIALDMGPSFGLRLNEYVSVGAGVDAVHLKFTLSNAYGPPLSMAGDAFVENSLSGWGVTWHGGVMVKPNKQTRIGFSFNGRVPVDTTGHSHLIMSSGQKMILHNQKSSAALPARAQLSIQHAWNQRWTSMFTAFYTHWKTFERIVLQNTLLPNGQTTVVNIPFNYENTMDYSFGSSYQITERILLRGGIEFYDQPSNQWDRGVADPIGKATILTAGMQYKVNDKLKFDMGLGHSFFKDVPAKLTNPLTSLNGILKTQTTTFGAQVSWQFA